MDDDDVIEHIIYTTVITLDVASDEAETITPVRHVSEVTQILISLFYGIGITANVLALALLARHESARSQRQTLLLRCLVASDFLALLGSFVLMHLQLALGANDDHAFCVARVILRFFGLGSGAVAVVMAGERWLALTRPFFYQKHVTARILRRTVLLLWFLVALLSVLPFAGFGLYFDEEKPVGSRCVRYRFAVLPSDIAYAYLVCGFGLLLCVAIVSFNSGVIGALIRLRKRRIPRRLSRVSSGSQSTASCNYYGPPGPGDGVVGGFGTTMAQVGQATREEVAFARLMVVISATFVLCWIPQLATILAAQMDPQKISQPLYRVADLAIALNFALDPFLYVVFRARARNALARGFKSLFQFKRRESNTQQTAAAGIAVANNAAQHTGTGSGNNLAQMPLPFGESNGQ